MALVSTLNVYCSHCMLLLMCKCYCPLPDTIIIHDKLSECCLEFSTIPLRNA